MQAPAPEDAPAPHGPAVEPPLEAEVVEPSVAAEPSLALTKRRAEVAAALPNHPEDIIKLAAINAAFYNGLMALRGLNLDEDLYWKAVEDLRIKYYRERNHLS